MKLTVIGDVHGHTDRYQKMLRQRFQGEQTIQLGDMGIGFKGVGLHELPPNHRWIRGNHDNPEKCKDYPTYLGEWGYLPELQTFYIGGAFSIDRAFRIPGVSWWEGEENSYDSLGRAIQSYLEIKPKYVVSHECPQIIGQTMLRQLMAYDPDGYFKAKNGCCDSRTAVALQSMFEGWKPRRWLFGHYHVDREFDILGTLFRCNAELSPFTFDTEE